MKQNKHPELDVHQPVTFDMRIPGVASCFTIVGDYESVLPVYESITKHSILVDSLSHTQAIRQPLPRKIGNVAVQAKQEATALVFDYLNNTTFHKQLKAERQYRRNRAMAGRLGLLSY